MGLLPHQASRPVLYSIGGIIEPKNNSFLLKTGLQYSNVTKLGHVSQIAWYPGRWVEGENWKLAPVGRRRVLQHADFGISVL